jgi:hypothetical protein
MTVWSWETDPSVKALPLEVARLVSSEYYNQWRSPSDGGAPAGIEVISPPLHGTLDLAAVEEMIWVLDALGVEAGPSAGMHVHINVLKDGHQLEALASEPISKSAQSAATPAAVLTPRQIANVWAHYARFQVVIDEFLIDNRIQNRYARPLLFQQQYLIDIRKGGSSKDYAADRLKSMEEEVLHTHMLRHMFYNMHAYTHHFADPKEFCNAIWTDFEDEQPCKKRYPSARYYQLNLIPLKRLRTIEFRGFPAPPLPATQTALNWGVCSGCFPGGQPNFEPLHFGQSVLGSWP